MNQPHISRPLWALFMMARVANESVLELQGITLAKNDFDVLWSNVCVKNADGVPPRAPEYIDLDIGLMKPVRITRGGEWHR